MNEKQVRAKIARMGRLKASERNAIACNLIGHSHIVTTCFGYVSCGRCESQIGDTLGGVFDLSHHVIVGHNCETCKRNARGLTWKDTIFVPRSTLKGIGYVYA